MKIVIIDNYDSFTFNLYQYLGEVIHSKLKTEHPGASVKVFRNDEVTIDHIVRMDVDRIIISPGPGSPDNKQYFGVCSDVITILGEKIPVLGVCLGMQGIAHCFGGDIIRAKIPMHGKSSQILHDTQGIFRELPQELEVMRYHSLVVDPKSLPDCLELTSIVSNQANLEVGLNKHTFEQEEIMGIRHREYPIEGIQFHPESFATEGSMIMLENFILQKR